MSTDRASALARVADVLSQTAVLVRSGTATSDLVWFEIDAAVDELFEAVGEEAGSRELCDAVAACVPLARSALARGEVDEAATVLEQRESRVREVIDRG